MSSFKDVGVFRSQKPRVRNPKKLRAVGVEHAFSLYCYSTQHARNSFWRLPQGYCEQKLAKSCKDNI